MNLDPCVSFVEKWFQFWVDFDGTPEDDVLTWNDFLNDSEYGLVDFIEHLGTPSNKEQLTQLFFDHMHEKDYGFDLTDAEASFLWEVYQRRNYEDESQSTFGCDVINNIIAIPIDKLDDDEYATPVAQKTLSAPASRPLSTPQSGPTIASFLQSQPAMQTLSMQPQQQMTQQQMMQPLPPFNSPIGGFGANPFAPVGGSMQPVQPIMPAEPVHDLPYVTVSLSGLKPSEKSRAMKITVEDPVDGQFTIVMFITAGQIPTQFNQTFFASDGRDPADNPQKAQIHAQNGKSFKDGPPGYMPAGLSNGSDPKGVCAEMVYAYVAPKSTMKSADRSQACKPGSNRPTSSTRPSGSRADTSLMSQPLSGSPFGAPMSGPPLSGVVGQPLSMPMSAPKSGPSAVVPTNLPPGTMIVQVKNFNKPDGPLVNGYQVPGGPRPIAMGMTAKKEPKNWFMYPDGTVVSSALPFLGAGPPPKSRKPGTKEAETLAGIIAWIRSNPNLPMQPAPAGGFAAPQQQQPQTVAQPPVGDLLGSLTQAPIVARATQTVAPFGGPGLTPYQPAGQNPLAPAPAGQSMMSAQNPLAAFVRK